MIVTYFAPSTPDPTLDDRAYAAHHCKQTQPTSTHDLDLVQLAQWCCAAARVGRKGDAGYIIAGDCSTTRKEGGAAPVALIDQDEGAHEPDWAALSEYEGFAWTTSSHRPDKPAWRVVIPFVTPMAHGKLRSPFKGGHLRNRTQPAFLPTHAQDVGLVEWRWLGGTKRLDAAELGGVARTYTDRDSSLLGALFEAADWVLGEQPGGLIVRCPWVHLHSDGAPGGTVVLHADPDGQGLGKFYCSRTECLKADHKTWDAIDAMRGIPTVAHELGRWAQTMNGWSKGDAPSVSGTADVPAVAGPTQDLSGLNLAPSGWPWVLRTGTWCWLHDPQHGSRWYGDAMPTKDMRLEVKRTCGRLIALEYTTAKGTKAELTEREFESQYEQRVTTLKASYLARKNTWDDKTRRLTLATLKWTDATSAFDADVDEWLRALAGPRYDRLAQWLASCVALDRPAPALYLHGELKVGKSLLARGLARLWQCEPAPFEEALASFNEATATCPLMYADEGFPSGMSFNTFRAMVTEQSRRVNEKHKPKYPVEGCVRIVLAANNAQGLRYQRTGALTSADMAAISDRLLVINAGAKARDVLMRVDPDSFVTADRLARHVLWLAETVALEPRGERMCARPEGAADVLEALQTARYATMIRVVADGKTSDGVLTKGDAGVVWVNVRLLDRAVQLRSSTNIKNAPTEQDSRDFVNAFRVGPKKQIHPSSDVPALWYHPLDAARLASQKQLLDE